MNTLPLYHRIFLSLRDRILQGEYDWQEPMPAEARLAEDFGASRATIRKAMGLLEEEGLIIRSQGARTYARAVGYSNATRKQNLSEISHDETYRELFYGNIDQHYMVVQVGKELSRQFNKQTKLGRVARVREDKGKPYCYVVTYLPLHIADKIRWDELGATPVLSAAGEAGFDFVKVDQAITATSADEETAAALDVPIGSALLRISGLFVDEAGESVMRKDGYFHPDSFEYRTTVYNTPR